MEEVGDDDCEEEGGEEESGRVTSGEEEETTEEHKASLRKSPDQPTTREVEEHMVTHVPYRSWCPYCIAGKSKADAHFNKGKRGIEMPEIHIDYMFMESEESENMMDMPILVGRDRLTGWFMAGVVPNKGKCPHAMTRIEGMMDLLGYKRTIFKSDQEPAIVELKREVARIRPRWSSYRSNLQWRIAAAMDI